MFKFTARRRAFSIIIFVFIIGVFSTANIQAQSKKITGSNQIPILMYHHISENPKDWGSASISSEKFRKDLEALKKAGYTTILPVDLVDFKEGRKSLPGKSIMITFDDGYLSNYELAFPILKELNMKATIHVIGDYRGRKPGYIDHFSWEQAKEMHDSGLVSIQSHTHNLHFGADNSKGTAAGIGKHKDESVESHKARIKADLKRSIDDIEKHIGEKALMVAYPYGIKSSYSDDILKELGLKLSLTVKEDIANIKSDLFSLPRINVPHDMASDDLVSKVNTMKLESKK